MFKVGDRVRLTDNAKDWFTQDRVKPLEDINLTFTIKWIATTWGSGRLMYGLSGSFGSIVFYDEDLILLDRQLEFDFMKET